MMIDQMNELKKLKNEVIDLIHDAFGETTGIVLSAMVNNEYTLTKDELLAYRKTIEKKINEEFAEYLISNAEILIKKEFDIL